MTLQAIGPRCAGQADVPALVRVINRAYAIERFFVEGDRTNETQIRERLEKPHAVFLVVEDGAAPGELAGAVHVEVRRKNIAAPSAARFSISKSSTCALMTKPLVPLW